MIEKSNFWSILNRFYSLHLNFYLSLLPLRQCFEAPKSLKEVEGFLYFGTPSKALRNQVSPPSFQRLSLRQPLKVSRRVEGGQELLLRQRRHKTRGMGRGRVMGEGKVTHENFFRLNDVQNLVLESSPNKH